MKSPNYEITLNNTPYFTNLINELVETLSSKKRLLTKVKSAAELNTVLSYEDRHLLKHLNSKEDKILAEIIFLKGWDTHKNGHDELLSSRFTSPHDFDEYPTNIH